MFAASRGLENGLNLEPACWYHFFSQRTKCISRRSFFPLNVVFPVPFWCQHRSCISALQATKIGSIHVGHCRFKVNRSFDHTPVGLRMSIGGVLIRLQATGGIETVLQRLTI